MLPVVNDIAGVKTSFCILPDEARWGGGGREKRRLEEVQSLLERVLGRVKEGLEERCGLFTFLRCSVKMRKILKHPETL